LMRKDLLDVYHARFRAHAPPPLCPFCGNRAGEPMMVTTQPQEPGRFRCNACFQVWREVLRYANGIYLVRLEACDA
jgi:hypothetical protein